MLITPDYSNILLTKKPTRVSPVDILVLSCVSHRLREAGSTQYVELESEQILKYVTPADTEMASKIRGYYGQKILMWKLQEKNFSKFRVALCKFFLSDGRNFSQDAEDWTGMIYRLPEFYKYDSQFDLIKHEYSGQKLTINWNKKEIKKLTPITCIPRKRQSRDRADYFLKVSDADQVARITLDLSNPLLGLWNSIFGLGTELAVEGIFNYSNFGELDHFEVSKWNIVNNIKV